MKWYKIYQYHDNQKIKKENKGVGSQNKPHWTKIQHYRVKTFGIHKNTLNRLSFPKHQGCNVWTIQFLGHQRTRGIMQALHTLLAFSLWVLYRTKVLIGLIAATGITVKPY